MEYIYTYLNAVSTMIEHQHPLAMDFNLNKLKRAIARAGANDARRPKTAPPCSAGIVRTTSATGPLDAAGTVTAHYGTGGE